jgi:hypothetical protein
MPKVEMHAPFKAYRGKIGDLVYRKRKGENIVSLAPDPDRTLHAGEAAHRQRFTTGAEWVTSALLNNELHALYEEIARERDIPLRAAALSDYLSRPVIDGPVDLSQYSGQMGDRISFMATDNVGVVEAFVWLRDDEGEELEAGPATPLEQVPGIWMYTAKKTASANNVHFTVQVRDRPGNVTEAVEVKSI